MKAKNVCFALWFGSSVAVPVVATGWYLYLIAGGVFVGGCTAVVIVIAGWVGLGVWLCE